MPIETLLGAGNGASSKRGPAPKLQRHIERVSRLPPPEQRFVMQMIETVLVQTAREGTRA